MDVMPKKVNFKTLDVHQEADIGADRADKMVCRAFFTFPLSMGLILTAVKYKTNSHSRKNTVLRLHQKLGAAAYRRHITQLSRSNSERSQALSSDFSNHCSKHLYSKSKEKT